MGLQEYIDDNMIEVDALAAKAGVHRSTIYRVLRGDGCTRRTAKRIEAATGGNVKASEVLAAQSLPDNDDDDEPAFLAPARACAGGRRG